MLKTTHSVTSRRKSFVEVARAVSGSHQFEPMDSSGPGCALRFSLKSFAQGRSRTPITVVTCQDIKKWIAAQEWAARRTSAINSFTVMPSVVRKREAAAQYLRRVSPAARSQWPKTFG